MKKYKIGDPIVVDFNWYYEEERGLVLNYQKVNEIKTLKGKIDYINGYCLNSVRHATKKEKELYF